MTEKSRPAGKGVGFCPHPLSHGRCSCHAACAECGNPLHSAIHMHVSGEGIGDPPFGHEFKPKDEHSSRMFAAAVGVPAVSPAADPQRNEDIK